MSKKSTPAQPPKEPRKSQQNARANRGLENAPQDLEKLSLAALESAPYGVLIHDQDGKILLFNAQLENISGFPKDEIPDIANWINKVYPDEDYRRLILEDQQAKVPKDRRRVRNSIITRKDGERRTCEFSSILASSGLRIVFIKDTSALRQAEDSLMESEQRFRLLSEAAFEGIIIHKDGVLLHANDQFFEMFGYEARELLGRQAIPILIAPESIPVIKEQIRAGTSTPYEYTLLDKSGRRIDVIITTKLINYEGDRSILGIVTDITERKQAEKALQVKDRKMERQAKNLAEVNTALKVLLEQRETEKTELKETLLVNIKKLIFPYIEKLEARRMDEETQTYLNIIKSNLNDLISPLANTLSSRYLELTPSEIQVADLIKEGKTSKDIASMLNVSPKAVSFHRGNLRKKLGLLNKKTNLRTYLQSLPQ